MWELQLCETAGNGPETYESRNFPIGRGNGANFASYQRVSGNLVKNTTATRRVMLVDGIEHVAQGQSGRCEETDQ